MAYSAVQVRPADTRYSEPLEGSLRDLAAHLGARQPLVLLGSVASPKYVSLLTARLGSRLLFPAAFAGRGDMSRGGLLLRQVATGAQLDYVPVVGAALHGERPPKLPRLLHSRTHPRR
ncbi:MAG: hypothetical protein ACE148_16740 [Vicinamibacterales bacterium]